MLTYGELYDQVQRIQKEYEQNFGLKILFLSRSPYYHKPPEAH